MKLGIIGAENSHAGATAALLNIEKKIPGFRATHLWGENEEVTQATVKKGNIPTVVSSPEEMIGKVDCVMIDHRHGKYHLPIATKFVKAGVPVFVDKPLSTSLAEAKKFLKLRAKLRVPVTSFSIMPLQASFVNFCKEFNTNKTINALSFFGPGDYKNSYGDLFFYAIHQVEMMVALLNEAPSEVRVEKSGPSAIALFKFKNPLTATLTLSPKISEFSVTAAGVGNALHATVVADANRYLVTAKTIHAMVTSGKEPLSEFRMLTPLAILEAMEKSLKTAAWTKIVL